MGRARSTFTALLHRFGVDIRRWPARDSLGAQIQKLSIDTVIDVGANAGQYGTRLRREGFAGRIASFEPLSEPFSKLQRASRQDPSWDCHRIALGDRDKDNAEMQVPAVAELASFLPMRGFARDILPEAAKCGRVEAVTLRRLDGVVPTLSLVPGRGVLLKCDTQGFELPVLRGAGTWLMEVAAVQLELSLKPMYHGQPTLEVMLAFMRSHGFELSWLESGFGNPVTHELLEVDGLFVRLRNDRFGAGATPQREPSFTEVREAGFLEDE
jgi:FkbM family methyltransferase